MKIQTKLTLNNFIKISKAIGKLGEIPSLDLPALKTCICCKCNKYCYALKGRYLFTNKQKNMLQNLAIYKRDPDGYFEDLHKFLSSGLTIYKYFRYHSSGDIVDEYYFVKMVEIANKCKYTTFLCFTKKHFIINEYIAQGGKVPKNLVIVFSGWDNSFKVVNPYNFPVANVRLKDQDDCVKIPTTANKCGGFCPDCLICWKLKKNESVVFDQH